MNRTNYFNYIEEKLNFLAYRIEQRGKINLLDFNIHSETFFADLCNAIYGLNFININTFLPNMEGIDLIDTTNRTVAQVSSTCTKIKIESSLCKDIYKEYRGYNYKFISISKNVANSLKREKFNNPYGMKFNPEEDIWDVAGFLRKIITENIEKQRAIYDFIKEELGQEVDYAKMESNLATVVNILAKEKLDITIVSPEVNSFAIEDKIEFNNLQEVREIIDEYKIVCHKLDAIYSEFDKEGQNKSFSILQEIRRQYIKIKSSGKSSEDIFYAVIDSVLNIIVNSKNYVKMPMEELQACVDIVVVDAFIRCKIFENPEGYHHVITR